MPGGEQSSADNLFSPDDQDRILDETFVRQIDYHQQLGSTNDHALELSRQAGNRFPLLVLTELQTSGRGRGSNSWWAKRGSLTFSVMLATEAAALPTVRWPQVSLTVGLAVSEALEELLAQGVPTTSLDTLPKVQLKWPNDVYIEGKKICGVLVEVPPKCPGKLLLGIGINVNNSFQDAPDDLQDIATSMFDLTGRSSSLTEVLIQVLNALAKRLEAGVFWSRDVVSGWRQRCYLTDKCIEIDNGTRQAQGVCRGIDDQGALLLDVEGGTEKHVAGVITVL